MKIQINNIYADNHNLFTNNALLSNDNRLTEIVALANDLDLITELTYGEREIFKRFLKDDDVECYVYDLPKIHKSVYSTIVENLLKYTLMLQADETVQDVNPLEQFYEKKITGERVHTDDIASRVDTTVHGNITTTDTYATVTEQNVVGQAVNTVQNGAREQTGAVTSFSSSTFENTDKTTQAQATDTQTLGTHTDTITTSVDSEHPDTHQTVRGNDTLTHGAHKDTITDDESIDEKSGYNDAVGMLEKRRSYVKRNTLNEIISDVINGVTYGVYTF